MVTKVSNEVVNILDQSLMAEQVEKVSTILVMLENVFLVPTYEVQNVSADVGEDRATTTQIVSLKLAN